MDYSPVCVKPGRKLRDAANIPLFPTGFYFKKISDQLHKLKFVIFANIKGTVQIAYIETVVFANGNDAFSHEMAYLEENR